MDNRQIVFEVCCGSLQSALNAQEGGAGRYDIRHSSQKIQEIIAAAK
ncbi:MAG: hypothetical protein IKY70_06385 [Bacteroidales bacterium]|nr:hypothetical protein [Bacteroidales bacterium]